MFTCPRGAVGQFEVGEQAGQPLVDDGDTIDVIDPATGEVRAMKLFVAASRQRRACGTTGASNYIYAEAVASEGLEDWILAHVRMFAFLGGVPKAVVPPSRACKHALPGSGQPEVGRDQGGPL